MKFDKMKKSLHYALVFSVAITAMLRNNEIISKTTTTVLILCITIVALLYIILFPKDNSDHRITK